MIVLEYDSTSSATQDIPFVITPDGNSGNGRWLQKEMSTAIRFFYGVVGEKFDAVATSDGATVTMSIEKVGGGDLTLIHPTRRYTLDCTPAATVTLTAGSDTSPQENFVYILESSPTTLTVSTSDWPASGTPHIKIAYFLVPSAAEVQQHGPWITQNWNEGTASGEIGHLAHMAETMRLTLGGSHYHSGVAGNGASNYITINTNVGVPDNVYFLSTAGVGYQMHRHTIPAKDTSATDDMHVVNYFGTPYFETQDIADLLTDATGASMSGKYFNLVFWFANNKSGEYSPLMVNLPTGSYNTLTGAISDTSSYDVYDIPKEFKEESSTGMLVCRITFQHSAASGGTWTVQNSTDLRGRTPGTASGSALAGTTEFPDNTFRIFDNLDDTKEIDFLLDGITTGNTRTITPADADMTLLSTTDYTDLTDGGESTLHYHNALKDSGQTGVSYVTAGAAKLNYAGNLRLQTGTFGMDVTDGTGFVSLYPTATGQIVFQGRPGAPVSISARDVSNAAKVLIGGDPDGSADLYYAGVKTVSSTATGLDTLFANEWTKAQNFNETSLTDAATIAWDVSSNQVTDVTITANRTMGAPTNLKAGAWYTLTVIQDGTGGWTMSWNAVFVWSGGVAPTLASAANDRTTLTFYCDGTYLYGAAHYTE
jgi:hypothetical protein